MNTCDEGLHVLIEYTLVDDPQLGQIAAGHCTECHALVDTLSRAEPAMAHA